MDNTLLGQCIITEHEMPHENKCLILAQPTCLTLTKVGFEIAIITVLEHEIKVLLVSETVVELDYKRTRECLQVGDFVFDLFLDGFSDFVDTDTLDCNTDAILAHAIVDLTCGSLAQAYRFVDSVVRDLHPHMIFVRLVHI